ncbi:tetratricopeptide repeat protein, partial [Plantactinospora sp. ZYX-F-223]|uniref:tetratricopeptide repeat protein n=1 Tax=Plantactinospora sp. ZYX-F-223 TaxID=3144103 RepID=UPI0031FD8FFB
LTTRINLAHWLGEVEGPARALSALTAVSADQARVLEPNHPDTMRTMGSLAHWRARNGDIVGAVDALKSLLKRQIRTLSSNHADVRATREVLAHWLDVLARGPNAVSTKRTTASILGRRRRVSE